MISHEQIKAARAMLNLSQKQLAEQAGISLATLNNIERGRQTDSRISTIQSIQKALEAGGIEFTSAYEGVSVLLKPKKSASSGATVLIIDDSREDRTLYRGWLGKDGFGKFRVVEAENARDGYAAFLEHRPDCIVLDFKMYGTDGFRLLAEMRKDRARLPPIVFVTALHSPLLKESAEKQGVFAYINKNLVTQQSFRDAVERALA